VSTIVRVARYLRVSKADQDPALQDDGTAELIAKRGWKLTETYTDHGISGTREKRPALDRLLRDARHRRMDVVIVWKADRLFRSLKAMVTTLDEWAALGVGFVSATEVFDSTTPQGKLLLHLTSAFAEFERSLIVERTKAGIAAARKRGVHVGRPRARVDADHLRELRADGMSVRKIAETLNIGVSTVQRRLLSVNGEVTS
jgi:DNA invertase Pin-like site-specific DNA recombinase